MQIEFGRWVFVPHFVLTLMVVFLLPILLGLSYWQWQRAHEKQSMLDAFAISQTQTPVSLVDTPVDDIKSYEAIKVTGTFLQNPIFLLDNQMHEGRAGFDVLGILKLSSFPRKREPISNESLTKMDSRFRGNDGTYGMVLINLGWIPRHAERQNLPILPALPQEEVTLTGRAYFPSDRSLVLGVNLELMPNNKILIQKIDFKQVSEVLAKTDKASHTPTLFPLLILADPDSSSPLVRDWQPPNTISPATHYGYAVQWLLLAITLCVLYLIFCTRRKTR